MKKGWMELNEYLESREVELPALPKPPRRRKEQREVIKDDGNGNIILFCEYFDDRLGLNMRPIGEQLEVLAWGMDECRDYNHDGSEVVYLMQTAGFVKIGRTKNVKKRLYGVQNGCPTDVFLIAVLRPINTCAWVAEGNLHLEVWDYWKRGEWFRDDVLDAPIFLSHQKITKIKFSAS